ncbi:tetratricopeptide repeat protein, partial [Myxococcota bacterium]|nr:tetratricopeptide repeat protein [Myxococcota bacterium]
ASAASGAWLALQARRAPSGAPLARRLAPTLAFSLALGLALTPTAARNQLVHRQPALVSHNGGLNFYLGNNLEWRETMFLRPGLPFRRLVLQAEPDKRDVAERNQWWWQRAREEIRQHPVAWLAILGTKALWSVHDTEIPRNEDYRCRTDEGPLSWVGRLPVRYGLVFPLALAGAVLLARRGGGGLLLAGTWVALHLPLVVFLVADRYRLATWPVVSLAAAVGLHALLQLGLAVREGARPGRGWLLLLPVLPVPFLPIDSRTAYDPAWCLHVDGNLALMAGDQDEAVALYQRALALDPDDWGARDFLARTLADGGDTAQAIALMEPLVDWFPDHYPSLYFLAGQYQRAGRLDLAADTMGRAWRVPGERTNTGVRYVKLLLQAGRRDEARRVVDGAPELQGHPGLADAFIH